MVSKGIRTLNIFKAAQVRVVALRNIVASSVNFSGRNLGQDSSRCKEYSVTVFAIPESTGSSDTSLWLR